MIEVANARNGNATINVEQRSPNLREPSESLNNRSNARTRRLQSSDPSHGSSDSNAQISCKGKEKLDPTPIFDVSCGHSHVEREMSG